MKSEKVKLRAIEPEDVDRMYQWENDLSVWPVSGTLTPFSKHTMEEFLRNAKDDIYTSRQLRLAIDSYDGPKVKTVGYIDLFDFDPPHRRAGTGILIAHRDDRRKGYAAEALKLLQNYAFGVLGLHQLYCHIHSDNEPSIRLFKGAGFKPCGELKDWTLQNGNWKTVQMFQKIHSEE